MPVEREYIPAEKLARNGLKMRLVSVYRLAAGPWYARFKVDGDVALSDGRQIDMNDEIPRRMNRQRGRRPARVPA